MVKKFILNAESVGETESVNRAVAEGFEGGLLKSVTIDPCGAGFDKFINDVLPKCEGLGVGIQINLTDGKFICTDLSLLNKKESYLSLLFKSSMPKNKAFMEEVERELRRQIEKVLSKAKITHISSKEHIHSIPPIFKLVCRLAKEYGIPYVRTHFEKFYFVPEIFRHLNKIFIKNFFKKVLLNFLSVYNENTVYKYGLETNDYLVGLSYAASMDGMSIYYGIRGLKGKKSTVEVLIHPCRYEEGTIDEHFDEYLVTKNKRLKSKIEKMGFEITNYAKDEPQTD